MPHSLNIGKQDEVAGVVKTAGEDEAAAVDLLATGKSDGVAAGLLTGKNSHIDNAVKQSGLSGKAKIRFDRTEPTDKTSFWAKHKQLNASEKGMSSSNIGATLVDDVVTAEVADSDELDGFVKTRSGVNKIRQIRRGVQKLSKVKTAASATSANSAKVASVTQSGATSSAAQGAVVTKTGASGSLAASASGGGGVAAGAASLPVLLVICIVFVLLLIVSVIAGSEENKIGGLSENESIVASLLKEQGFDEVHIAAIMGNWVVESECNPRRVQCGFGYCRDFNGNGVQDCEEQDNYPPELIDNGNAGYGLAQWTYPTRARALVAFAAEQGNSSGDAAVQVAFFAHEFRHARVNFEAIDDVEAACRWFHDVYERSADGAAGLAKRVSEAKRIYAVLTGAGANGYIAQALAIANDDSHGYSMASRLMNPDVDCSSFVYYSLLLSGWSQDQLGGSYPFTTHNMGPILESAGFTRFDYTGMQDLLPGDILVNPARHTEIYYGDGLNLGAHSNYDGRAGDSSGREVCLGSFWESGWVNVYRLAG